MKKNGFTMVELLAVLIILGIVVGITILAVNSSSDDAKKKSEEVFISSLKSAVETYLETDGITELKANEFVSNCNIIKKGVSVETKKYNGVVTFQKVIDSSYKPMSEKDFVNPANKEPCYKDAEIMIYKDADYVSYYKFKLSDLRCFKYHTEEISILPACS